MALGRKKPEPQPVPERRTNVANLAEVDPLVLMFLNVAAAYDAVSSDADKTSAIATAEQLIAPFRRIGMSDMGAVAAAMACLGASWLRDAGRTDLADSMLAAAMPFRRVV